MEARRTIGVILAGVGGVGDAVMRALQQHFSTSEVDVRPVAIGDSKGFVSAMPNGLEKEDVAAILDHKKRGHSVSSWIATTKTSSTFCTFDNLVDLLHEAHEQRTLDDYVVLDCTSSQTIAPALRTAKRLDFAIIMANKLPVGGPLELYQELTQDANGRVRYEATVGAGIPVISVVQRIVASRDSIKMIQGGLNGTMTYILNAMIQGESFSASLNQVHGLGITENDPREDLSGADVARKMVILARELGFQAETSDVEIVSLLPAEAFSLPVEKFMASLHTYDDGALYERVVRAKCAINVINPLGGAVFNAKLQAAKREGCALAYIGTVHTDGRIRIGLEHVPPTSFFATASSTEGVVSISSEWFPEPLMLRGTGAGAASTAAAVVGDLAAIISNI